MGRHLGSQKEQHQNCRKQRLPPFRGEMPRVSPEPKEEKEPREERAQKTSQKRGGPGTLVLLGLLRLEKSLDFLACVLRAGDEGRCIGLVSFLEIWGLVLERDQEIWGFASARWSSRMDRGDCARVHLDWSHGSSSCGLWRLCSPRMMRVGRLGGVGAVKEVQRRCAREKRHSPGKAKE